VIEETQHNAKCSATTQRLEIEFNGINFHKMQVERQLNATWLCFVLFWQGCASTKSNTGCWTQLETLL